jgi:nicotinate phosphoribosyltransferase
VTSSDAPYLDCAYKLVEYAGRPRWKRSEGKVTYPGRKQVIRVAGADGVIRRDRLVLEEEVAGEEGRALLELVMEGGRRRAPSPTLADVRRRAAASLASLPGSLRALATEPVPPLAVSSRIEALMGPTGRE